MTIDRERAKQIILKEMESPDKIRAKRAKFALAKLNDPDKRIYEMCTCCHKKIGKERLFTLPATIVCVDCQREIEERTASRNLPIRGRRRRRHSKI